MIRLILAFPLLFAACQKDESVSGYADSNAIYVLQEINGHAFVSRATLHFPEAGKVQGDAPCNAYFATQTVPYPWIRIENIAVTKRICPDFSAESKFFAALSAMTLVEVLGDTLILSNDDDTEMVFESAQ